MLPECSLMDDVHRIPSDSETTLAKRRSFADQYVLLVRQDATDFVENTFSSTSPESIRDFIVIQDERLPCLSYLFSRLDSACLSSLYIIDCWVRWSDEFTNGSEAATAAAAAAPNACFDSQIPPAPPPYPSFMHPLGNNVFSSLNLCCLVLSYTHLTRLPQSLFEMISLEILKVDHNNLEEISSDIGQLVSLRVFCCDSQRPRLRSFPASITRLQRLEVLSFSNNRIENVSWLVALTSLKVLKCDRNHIIRFPAHLANLKNLTTLDISHNRIDHIPASPVEMLSRLYSFEYFNLSLRPKHVRHDRAQLFGHLEMEYFLQSLQQQSQTNPALRLGRDITLAVVGETHSGKSSLIEALKDEKGISRGMTDAKQMSHHGRTPAGFEAHQFDMRTSDGSISCHVSAIVMGNDIFDNYTRNLKVDFFLLAVDMTSLEMHNGSQHLFARHVSRLQMWLQALYELAPETPVFIVGTHAELVRSTSSVSEIWNIVEGLLDQSRPHHARRYGENRCPFCLICNPKTSGRQTTQSKSRATTSGAGFVDLSSPHFDTTSIVNGHPTSDSTTPGHLSSAHPINSFTSSSSKVHSHRYPHVAGYYEIDSKKPFPKDSKKANASIDQLKAAITRLSSHQTRPHNVPIVWLAFVRHLTAIREQASGIPCLPYDEIVSIARSFEIPPNQVPVMLQYFHERGNVVFFPKDPNLLRLVVINPTWFVSMIRRALEAFEQSKSDTTRILQCLSDKELDRHLLKASSPHLVVTSGQWLLSALQVLDLCLPIADCPATGDQVLVFPNLLESGSPSQDVWPDVPEWDEKQITCDFRFRCLKPNQFIDFVRSINREGRHHLEIVPDPVPVLLSHHVVFFTSIDLGGCDDCCNTRRKLRMVNSSGSGNKQQCCHQQQLHQSQLLLQHSQQASVTSSCDEFDVVDDVMHKVHIMLHSSMDAIRIQVRGVSPCCTMKAVLNFLELYFDDVPDDWTPATATTDSSSSNASDRASLNSQTASVSSESRGGSSGGGGGHHQTGTSSMMMGSHHFFDDDDDRHFFLLCPKCVLLRHSKPERIIYHQSANVKRKAICNRWHNLGSWTRAITGDYRCSNTDLHLQTNLTSLPDYEHPRLVLLLPPSLSVSTKEWYMFSRVKFLEGFEVHFLCENPTYWHMTENSGFRLQYTSTLRQPQRSTLGTSFKKMGPGGGNQIATILSLALSMVQVVQGVNEHGQTSRLIAPVVSDLIKMYDYLRNVDPHCTDAYAWLTKNKDRVVTMLTKVLANASDGLPDLYFKAGSSMSPELLFQSPSKANRIDLSRFLKVETSSGRFGQLRPLYVGREIRWVCDAHYEELRTLPTK